MTAKKDDQTDEYSNHRTLQFRWSEQPYFCQTLVFAAFAMSIDEEKCPIEFALQRRQEIEEEYERKRREDEERHRRYLELHGDENE